MAPILGILSSLLMNKYALMAITAILIITGAYLYYLRSEIIIKNLRTENSTLEDTVKQQTIIIQNIQRDVQMIMQTRTDYQKKLDALKARQTELDKVLHRQEYNKDSLGQVARKDPKSVQFKINRSSQNTLSCFEKITKNEKTNCFVPTPSPVQ